MTPHAAEIAPPEDLSIFYRIKRIVQELPDLKFADAAGHSDIPLFCHLLCRGLSEFFPVKVQAGWLMEAWEHSWLLTRNGLVIDPYPVAAIGGPLMLDTRYITPWTEMYTQAVFGCFLEHRSPFFLANVSRVAAAIRTFAGRLGICCDIN